MILYYTSRSLEEHYYVNISKVLFSVCKTSFQMSELISNELIIKIKCYLYATFKRPSYI